MYKLLSLNKPNTHRQIHFPYYCLHARLKKKKVFCHSGQVSPVFLTGVELTYNQMLITLDGAAPAAGVEQVLTQFYETSNDLAHEGLAGLHFASCCS